MTKKEKVNIEGEEKLKFEGKNRGIMNNRKNGKKHSVYP